MIKKPEIKTDSADTASPDNLTRDMLTAAAYRYLERFASTEAQLIKVLWQRIDRKLKPGGGNASDGEAIAAARRTAVEVAGRCVELGLVNDRLYAEARARRLLAKGKPLQAIRMGLKQKGVTAPDIAVALESLEADQGERGADMAAAITFARSRRLGPFRRPLAEGFEDEALQALKRKEYGRMARAGFGYQLSRRVLEAKSPDELDD
jgi:regulatory protein